jgi:ankyrin repeat protein
MTIELFQSIEQHNVKRLAELLSRGADPNGPHVQQPSWSPLKAAIEELAEGGPIEAVVLLLRHGASVDGPAVGAEATPLLVAVSLRLLNAAQILLAAGADPNANDDEGDSPLRLSVEQSDCAMVALLLLCGASATVNSTGGPSGMTALGRAVSNLSVPIVELLVSAGADPDVLDADRQSAHDRMPPRDAVDPKVWDTLKAMLARD